MAAAVPKITRGVGDQFAIDRAAIYFSKTVGRLPLGRRDDDDLVRVDVIQHDPGTFFEHVGVEIVGAHQRHLLNQAYMVGAGLGLNDFRCRNIRAKFKQRDNALTPSPNCPPAIGTFDRYSYSISARTAAMS